MLVGFVLVCFQFRLHGRKIHGFFDDLVVIRDVLHIDGFVKVSVLVSSAPPTQLFGGNGHPTAAQQIVHCFALRDCSGVFTPLFGGGRGGGGGQGGRRGEGRVGIKLLLFQCRQSSTFRHFHVLAWHVSKFVWVQGGQFRASLCLLVQCFVVVGGLCPAGVRWGNSGKGWGGRKMEKEILGSFKGFRPSKIGEQIV